MKRDLEQLRLLSIFHYLVGCIAGLFAFLPIFHFGIGLVMALGGLDQPGGGPPPAIGWFFMTIAGGAILLGLLYAAGLIVAGYFLGQQRHRIFIIVVAALGMAFTPFGTVLGVFTIVVLMRDSVIALFEEKQGEAFAA